VSLVGEVQLTISRARFLHRLHKTLLFLLHFLWDFFCLDRIQRCGMTLDLTVLYFTAKSTESAQFGHYGPFKTLIVDGFDPDQIWEEILLRSEPLSDYADAKLELLLDRADDIESDLTAFAGKTKRQKVRPTSQTTFFRLPLESDR
jgi:hypothetical protein